MDYEFSTQLPNITTALAERSNQTDDVYGDDLRVWRIGLYGVGGLVVACLGILGNSITIFVLAHFRQQGSAIILLMSLSVFDTIYLMAEAALENLTYIAKDGMIDDGYRTFIRPVYGNVYPVPEISKFCVSYVVIVITMERYVAVVWPFKAKQIIRRWMAFVSVLVVTAVSIIYHIPMYLAYGYSYTWDDPSNATVFRFYRTEFGLSHFYNDVYHTWINLTAKFLLPFTILLILNTHMMVTLRRSRVASSQTRDSQEHKLTMMVISMILIYFFCSLFPAVSFVLTTRLNSFTRCSTACNRFSAIADLLRIVNSATNFLIYCVMGQNFRAVFKQLFCATCKLKCNCWRHKGDTVSPLTRQTTKSTDASCNSKYRF